MPCSNRSIAMAANIAHGLWGDPRPYPARPQARPAWRLARRAEQWAAISVTVLLVAFVVLFLVKPGVLPFWMATIIACLLLSRRVCADVLRGR